MDWGQNQDGSDELKSIFDINNDNAQFILCQLNEKTETTPNCMAYDVTATLKLLMPSKLLDHCFYLPLLKDNDWQITRFHKGEEDTLTEQRFLMELRK